MKNLYLLVCLLALTRFGFPQNSVDVDKLKPKISPQSPNVAALGRFGEHPVNLNTGIPTITVPIYEIEAGTVKVPVSLDYHAGGNKVTDVASWAGLGWALNAGGVISRTVIGRPDEVGILNHPLETGLNNFFGQSETWCGSTTAKLEEYTKGTFDAGFDIFSFSIPGKSGKFILMPDGTGSMATSMPYERIKITYSRGDYNNLFTEFRITDENGITYTFKDWETVTPNTTNQTQFSAWHLSSIQGTRPGDVVLFSYTPYSYSSYTDFLDTETLVDRVEGSCTDGVGERVFSQAQVYTSFYAAQLTEIVFPGGKLTLSGFNRTDLPGTNNTGLDKIDLYGRDLNAQTYRMLKRFDLQQSYFTGSSYSPLKLDAVALQDADGSTIGTYRFDYNGTALPGPTSRSRDTWGYYNGKNNVNSQGQPTLIPQQQVSMYNVSGYAGQVTVGGADRSPSESHMQAWVLNKITYPTGGFSRFYYEANKYYDQGQGVKLAGGLRIKRLETAASDYEPVKTKTYQYGENESGWGDLNINLNNSLWSTNYTEKVAPDCKKRTSLFTSNFNGNLVPFDGSPVTYREVAEYDGFYQGAIQSTNGKTVYRFRTSGDMTVGLQGFSNSTFLKSFHWNRGQLESKTVYNNSATPVFKQVNTYGNAINAEIANAGLLAHKQLVVTQGWMMHENNANALNQPPCSALAEQFAVPVYYAWPKGNVRLYKTEEYAYSQTNGGQWVLRTTETDYDNYFQAKEQRVFESDGTIGYTRFRYAYDFALPGNPSGFARGIQRLVSRNMLSTILEEYSFKKINAGESDPLLTGGKLTVFGEFLNEYAFPTEMQTLNIYNNCCRLSSFTPATVGSGSLVKNGNYVQAISYESYDGSGNLTSYIQRNGIRTQVNWLSENQYLNGFTLTSSALQSEVLNPGSAPSLTTQYSYYNPGDNTTIPLQGVKTVTDPNNWTTKYEYDRFSRLRAIRDHNNNLVKSFDYNYAFGSRNTKSLSPSSINTNTLEINPGSLNNVSTGGATQTITVSSNVGWSVSSNVGWITANPASGNGNGSFNLVVASNSSTARNGNVSVNGGGITRTLTVSQAGTNGSGNPCNYTERQVVGTWNGLQVQLRQYTVNGVATWLIVTADASSATDVHFPRGQNFADQFSGFDKSCLGGGNTAYGGLGMPDNVATPAGYDRKVTSDGAVYFERQVQ
ncbi:hypothetical protein GCM10023189_33000 [Nibrella saemangeumensis]|uniref:BACON domain-containing protein n=1 Tax=Nibrella saemangeumensis TaxID=1084526 RepID=A0ABP8N0W0_9BACT